MTRRKWLWAAVIGAVVVLTAGLVVAVSPPVRQFLGMASDNEDPQPIASADLSPGAVTAAARAPVTSG